MAQDPGPRGEGVIPQGQEKSPKGRGSYLPRELRIKLFDEVVGLRKRGLLYREIIDEVHRRYGVRLSESTISAWSRGIHNPYNGRYIPSIDLLRPSEELAYIIGAKLGDGYVTMQLRVVKTDNRVRKCFAAKIGLEVKDRDFAEEFAKCLTKILGRAPIKPKLWRSRYVVEVGSKTLYELLKKPVDLNRLIQYIEHCERCMAAFLRGFFDSEGCIDERGHIFLFNSDHRLLEYVRELLQRLGIVSTAPLPKTRRGTISHNPKTGKKFLAKKDVYLIRIRTNSNHSFYEKVGFTIKRKQKRLEKYLRRHKPNPFPSFYPFSCSLFHGYLNLFYNVGACDFVSYLFNYTLTGVILTHIFSLTHVSLCSLCMGTAITQRSKLSPDKGVRRLNEAGSLNPRQSSAKTLS